MRRLPGQDKARVALLQVAGHMAELGVEGAAGEAAVHAVARVVLAQPTAHLAAGHRELRRCPHLRIRPRLGRSSSPAKAWRAVKLLSVEMCTEKARQQFTDTNERKPKPLRQHSADSMKGVAESWLTL